MEGIVAGGWEYVVAAYLITAATLLAYGASVFVRERSKGGRA
ncbi:MAG TPA: hypothetical protein VIL97_09065 [Thermoanaerobaculia bacterium]